MKIEVDSMLEQGIVKIEIRISLSFLKREGVPNRYAIKAKEVSPEILFTSTKPYYIPFYHNRYKLKIIN